MKFRLLFLLITAFNLCVTQYTGSAQDTVKSVYDAKAAFSPLFFNQNGNEYRSASGQPGPRYWQNKVDYHISARLDEQNHKISGVVDIDYKNYSPDQLPYLWLQLDQNLFKAGARGKSILGSGSRYGARGERVDGGYKIESMTVSQSGKSVRFDTLIEDTRMQIQLKKPVDAKTGRIHIKLTYSFNVPINGSDRMGRLATKNGEIYAVGQWFPRMCVYDDVNGWNTLPYWGAGEFYCEYGDIWYAVTVPANHILVGSGQLLNPREVFTKQQVKLWKKASFSDSTTIIRSKDEIASPSSRPSKSVITWKFKMNNTRDVAWASSKAFILEAAKINLPEGKKSLAVSAQPIETYKPQNYAKVCQNVKAIIEYYSNTWAPYPYPMAVSVISNVSGMEYPGIIFCGWGSRSYNAWSVVDHELGHTWFPMIVGSNERKFGWMDEGLNTFINKLSSDHYYKRDQRSNLGSVQESAKYLFDKRLGPIMQMPDAMPEEDILINIYSKPALGLQILRESILGPKRFDYAFRKYIKQWSFRHPTPDDFFRAMESGSGENLSWFWRGWFLENWTLDQGIKSVNSNTKDNAVNSYTIVISNLGKMPMPVILQLTTKSGKTETYHYPVDVWMKRATWSVTIPINEELAKVELDPLKMLPDLNPANNSWVNK